MNIESWFGSELQILTEIRSNVDLEFVRENPRFLMPTFQSVTVRILTVFDDFWPVVTLLYIFLGFHMLLRPKYCHPDEESDVSQKWTYDWKRTHQWTHQSVNGYGWGHSGTIYTIFVENPLIFDTDGVNGGFRPISWLSDGALVKKSKKISI